MDPDKKSNQSLKNISVVIPFKFSKGNLALWAQVRQSQDDLSGLLEFPGGKIEVGESPRVAGCREVMEEVGVDLIESELIKFKVYNFGSLLITIFLYFDSNEVFTEDGFKSAKELLDEPKRILPNNKTIINEIITYFWDFNPEGEVLNLAKTP